MPGKSRIETDLEPADLAEFQRLLANGRLTIDGLTQWLDGQGYEISRSSVGRYVQGFEQVAAKLRQSRQMAEALVAELSDAATQGKQGRMLVELGRSIVFDLMMKIQSDGAEIDTKDVQQLGKGLADLARALRLDQDFETKLQETANKKAAVTAAEAAREAGLSDEAAAAIQRKILGVEA
jgi:hypothetical protein